MQLSGLVSLAELLPPGSGLAQAPNCFPNNGQQLPKECMLLCTRREASGRAGRRAAAKVGEGEYTTDTTTQRGNESMARFDISNRTHYRVAQKKGAKQLVNFLFWQIGCA